MAAFANCYAGGGSDEAEIYIAVPELVRAAGATVADISMPAASRSADNGSSSNSDSDSGSGRGMQPGAAEAAAVAASAAAAERAAVAAAAVTEQRAAAVASAAALPQPWPAGAGVGEVQVTLEGVVAHKRKIARLLLFANLVPLSALADSSISSPAAANGSGQGSGSGSGTNSNGGSPSMASYMRRLWRHPDTQAACEVQLILGKTLERRLGR